MSIAEDTLRADLTLELRRDLAATRNALERTQTEKDALRRQVEQQHKLLRLMHAEVTAALLKIENVAREIRNER